MPEQGQVAVDQYGNIVNLELPNQQAQQNPLMGKNIDNIEKYGSIIKDLTDTEKILLNMELKLRGKMLDKDGKEIDIPDCKIRMDRDAAAEYMEMVRSIVNLNTSFTKYDTKQINNLIMGFNYNSNRFLMFQGEKVPLRYRGKITYEALNLISAVLYKANEGTILKWTKGSFTEGHNTTQQAGAMQSQQQGRSLWSYILPGGRRR